MKKLIIIIMAASMFLANNPASAQNTDNIPVQSYENYIQVNGKAEKEIVPDEIYLRIVVNEENLKSRRSVETVEQEMIQKLKGLGINTDENLKIDNMSSNYKNYVLSKNNPKTTAAYQLKVDGAATLGRVFQAMESIGISDMSIIRLSHSRIKELQNEVRIEAMRNAQQTAASLAEAVGQKAGRAVHIVDYNNDLYVPVMERADVMMLSRAKGAAEDYTTELEFKTIKITYNVSAKFVLE